MKTKMDKGTLNEKYARCTIYYARSMVNIFHVMHIIQDFRNVVSSCVILRP